MILIRHGQTDHNIKRRYCGSNDPGLNHTGVIQAHMLKQRLKDEKIDEIYSSGQKRAYQTAEIIFSGKNIKKHDGLREMSFGIFEGMTYGQIMAGHAKIYADWVCNPSQTDIPKGENLKSLYDRVRRAMHFILSCSSKNKTIAVVAHGGPNRIILCDAYEYSLEKFWQIDQDNSALNIIEYFDSGNAKVLTVNDTTHLSGQKASEQ